MRSLNPTNPTPKKGERLLAALRAGRVPQRGVGSEGHRWQLV